MNEWPADAPVVASIHCCLTACSILICAAESHGVALNHCPNAERPPPAEPPRFRMVSSVSWTTSYRPPANAPRRVAARPFEQWTRVVDHVEFAGVADRMALGREQRTGRGAHRPR